jgi:protein-S-isoprenylcysteine O-methyltransferase Ste14
MGRAGQNGLVKGSLARAWIGTILFLLVAPGVIAGLVPWWITEWRGANWGGVVPTIVGILLISAGVVFVFNTFALFATEGRGTPAPIAPTEKLVIGGIYRYVRNPMYLAVASVILGQALLFGSWWVLVYAGLFMLAVFSFVHWYEEPTLLRAYGAQYEHYRANVRGWMPRRTPWRDET